jgi:hypothetical protein
MKNHISSRYLTYVTVISTLVDRPYQGAKAMYQRDRKNKKNIRIYTV